MYLNRLLPAVLAPLGLSAPAPAAESPLLDKRLDNGVGRLPALGWNSWNVAQCDAATEAAALEAANKFIELGLKDLGYHYINIDDCWAELSRNDTGYLVPDPVKWPNGIQSAADQIHRMGLEFGLYGCAGTKTCAGYPGSEGYEQQDADTLASWGVDYWKYDNCNTPSGNTSTWMTTMSKALGNTSRPILFSLCQWGFDEVWTWGADVGNSWRMDGDISPNWGSVSGIAAAASGIYQYAAPGGFNDLDMMEIGNGGLTESEERAHFGLWAITKSPIILGTNLTTISNSSLAIIKNEGILSINQDRLGKAATYFQPSGAAAPVSGSLYPYWAGPLTDGVVVGIVAADGEADFSVDFANVPGLGPGVWYWREFYSDTEGYSSNISIHLPSHDMAVYKVSNRVTR